MIPVVGGMVVESRGRWGGKAVGGGRGRGKMYLYMGVDFSFVVSSSWCSGGIS
jgi:hypothetical protein